MKCSIFLFAVFGISLSVQEGYYHKQYQYKSSSSSYKNNELQRKTDDEEFSSVHGDLSGQNDPKVNAYTQHTEYRNPNAQDGDHFAGTNLHGAGGSSQIRAHHGLGYGAGADDVTGTIAGQRKDISYTGTYTVSGGQTNQLQRGSYDTQSNLLDLTQRLQNSLSGQLSRAVSEHHRSSGQQASSGRIEGEILSLEDELRANLTRSLQEELNSQYGSQTRRGAHSYSTSQGTHGTPNYNTQELDDLTQQVQTNLLDQLRREYQTQSSSSAQSSYSSSSSYAGRKGTYDQSGTAPHYYRPSPSPSPSQQISSSDYTSRAHTTMYRQEIPTVHPSESLVDVTSKAQTELDAVLNRALMYLKVKYMNDNTYKSVYQPDYDIILNDLTAELKQNITREVHNALRNAYGLQEEKNGYYFSTWNLNANVANYKTEDLDNLRRQVEKNLLDKLTQEVRNQKSSYAEKRIQYQATRRQTETQTYNSWGVYPSTGHDTNRQHSSQSQYSSSSTYGGQYPRSRYPTYAPHSSDDQHQQQQQQQTEDFAYSGHPTNTYSQRNTHGTHRDDQQQVEEVDYQYKPQTQRTPSYGPSDIARYPSTDNSHSMSHTSQSESNYQYATGTRQSAAALTPTPQLQTAEITRIQDELNRDLSQQVQHVIQQQRDQGQVYSSSQTSQAAVDDLTEEFKRNFSRRVEEVLKEHGVRGGYSFMITSTGSLHDGQNNGRFVELTGKLQEDLLKQLREGLASRQSYHSSSSSSSSSYQPVRYSSSYSGGSSASHSSGGGYSGHGGGYGTHSGSYAMPTTGYGASSGNYQRGSSYLMQSGYRGVDYQQGGECCMQSDETASPKSITPPRARADMPVELEAEPQRHKSTERPKARDEVAGTTAKAPASEQQAQIPVDQQKPDDRDPTLKLNLLTQDISKQLDALTQHRQTVDSTQSIDLTQQTENFGPFYQQPTNLTQQTQNPTQFGQQSTDLTQQTQNSGFFNRESSDLTQKTEDIRHFDQQSSDLTQQTQDFTHFDQQSSDLTQQTHDFRYFDEQSPDLTQQVVEADYFGPDFQQQTSDLTQKTEHAFGKSSGYSLQAKPNTPIGSIKQTEDFPQQKPDPERTIAQEKISNLEENVVNANGTEAEATTERKGFWKKLGGKISTGLNTVRDKIQNIG